MKEEIKERSLYFNKTVNYLMNLIYNKRNGNDDDPEFDSELLILECILSTKIKDLGFENRTFNSLNNYHSLQFSKINTFNDLMYFSPSDFLKFKCIGKKSFSDLIKIISEKGFEYGEYQGFEKTKNNWFHNTYCWKFVGIKK